MTTEQLFATIAGIIVATAFATGVNGFVLWFFFSRKGGGAQTT
ncbi:MAG TPA: hypothetical protein VF990_16635 [Candidatus Dormibacteraeota bacterium]